jgi:hypothetical protein
VVVPKSIPESLTLRMLYRAFSDELQEDIGPFAFASHTLERQI